MTEVDFDHAVVGAGIVGSWTALHLLRLGKKVLLLEQFPEPHTRGSSHGQSRIIRSFYAETFFAEMMPHAFRMWTEAEEESGSTLMQNVGALCIARSPEEIDTYRKCVINIETFCPHQLDTQDTRISEVMSRRLDYGNLHGVFLDKSGGVLFAHKALLAIQALYRKQGGQLWNNCRVHRIEPIGDDGVKLYTDTVVTVRSVVVCAGPWTQTLLSPHLTLPLKAVAVRVYYWKEKEEGVYSAKNGFPVLIDLSDPNIYALPSLEYPGLVKVCIHGGVVCDPDARDQAKQCAKLEEKLKDYVKNHLPLLETEPSILETCMYTVTPDEIFIVDSVPNHKNIVFGAGFSGTGFKTAPVVGKLLSEMAIGAKPFLDITPLRLARFSDSDTKIALNDS